MHWLRVVALVAACGLCVPVYGQDAHAPQDTIAAPVAVGAGPATTPAPVAQTPAASPTDPQASASTAGINDRLVAGDDAAPNVDSGSKAAVDPSASPSTVPIDPVASPLTLSNSPDAITVTALVPAYASVWQHIRAGFKMPTIDDPLVRKWESFYAARPEYWQRINERGKRYLHYITHEIERRGMPLEIALLPVIESAYNPEALSRARALGIWQFIPATGKHYGLEQNWWVDNRRDVSVATNSALDYLEKLHEMFGDWQLALAGYNWGEGAVQRAMAKNRAHGQPTDYASLKIPNETRNYLPKLQAVKNLVMAPENFGLTLPEVPDSPYFVTVTTVRQIDVALAAKLADMPIDDFKILNPAHNRPVVAGIGEQRINLPYNKAEAFVMNLDSYRQPLVSWRSYEIKHGETLDQIAPQVGIGLDELKRVNGLTGRKRIFPGFTLLVPAKAGVLAGPIPIAAFREAPDDGPGWHKVRRGESLAAIAQRYGLTASDLRRLNGQTADRLSAGRKLRLYDGVSLGAGKSKSGRVVARKRGAVKPTRRHQR